MAPVNTWNICSPVMVKKVAPKSGEGIVPSGAAYLVTHSAGRLNGRSPSLYKWFHSIKCRMINARPKKIVARIHLRARALSPRLDAETPNTIVKLDDSRQNVITEEKTMLG